MPSVEGVTMDIKTDFSAFTDLIPYEDDDSANARTHIVNPVNNRHISGQTKMSAQDIVDTARITGAEVVALCGYKWVPKRNPEKYDVCTQCMHIAQMLIAGS